jgi:hypothetical protein
MKKSVQGRPSFELIVKLFTHTGMQKVKVWYDLFQV